MLARTYLSPTVKTLKTPASRPFGYLPGPAGSTGVADPRCFPGKTGSLFPDQEPPLFSGNKRIFLALPTLCMTSCILPIFTVKRTRLNCTVFFLIKTARFKKYRFKAIIVEGIGTISTGAFRHRIRPGNSPSENGSWERVCPAQPPFIKRSCPKGGAAHSGRAGSCNRPAPTI